MPAHHDRLSTAAGLLRAPSLRSAVPPFMVMDVIAEAARREAAGQRVIHMEVGQPGTPAPLIVREAAKRAIDTETLGYTEALGIPALRQRIARHYRDWYGVDVSPDRIVVTTGSSAAFVLAFLALFNPGDRVLLPSPGYPCYRHILSALGVETVLIETGPETRWMPTAEGVTAQVSASDGAAGLLVASPSNPTGTMLERERLEALIAACRKGGVWFISDEIYHGLTYEVPATSALQVSDDVVVINSFSKYFSMTGWRIGWMVVPDALVRPIERLAQNLYISTPGVAQAAALAAFDAHEELQINRAVYAANRALLLAELPKAGFDSIVPADGAFYLYVDVSRLTDDSATFTRQMLEETSVAATPGLDFDAARGSKFVRFSYSRTTEDMAEGVRRLQAWPRLQTRA
jgi:aspartate/methionine/tyrosine aminotransferase